MDHLNYHHLRYFREVAHEGHLTRAAERLNVSQSALSSQLRQLEDRLGQPLFNRVGRRLELTEAGEIALDHADRIFGTGQELLDVLLHGAVTHRPLRVGALSTLSRNFQLRFLTPLLEGDNGNVVLKSGGEDILLADLTALALDVVLTTSPPAGDRGDFISHALDQQPVGLYGAPRHMKAPDLATLLAQAPLIVPTESPIRIGMESLFARLDVSPRIIAEVDDMAMVRLLARAGHGVAVAPAVVLADEIANGRVVGAPFDLDIQETFYAVTTRRSFPHPQLAALLDTKRAASENAAP